ncbi:aminodeoxychorismate synthase component I [Rhodococcus sp. ARC_M6]|uniref:aminodeoxychorismate synthase component I n=1 Tax=Rhodococcus sp. ARC_M6 TaxID=2928852 RepID=UPI001FB2D8CB|nr:aminodeoxychorismate synthase component I [Rhodococcus sp. ARC_M6]MCJ0905044.1 aminodeoxychorismate synthase component I [Rhodococcus sp. ARC_M6]
MSSRTLLVDNYDSFTYNLFTLLTKVNGVVPTVITNDADWDSLDLAAFDNVVISPGPGRPDRGRDFGVSRRFVEEGPLPLLGVCLGHQGLCQLFGADVVLAPKPMHGRISLVDHDGTGVFAGLPSPFRAVRYHSLTVENLPDTFVRTAWTSDGLIMGVRHRTKPMWGVQFHPESISTEFGVELLTNFRNLSIGRTLESVMHQDPPVHASSLRPASSYRVDKVRLDFAVDPSAAYSALFADGPNAYWLDRAATSEPDARFTIMGDASGPLAEFITYDVGSGVVTVARKGLPEENIHVPFFDYLDGQLVTRFIPADPELDFNLGYVGYLGYELKAQTGGVSAHSADTPDAAFVFADRAVVIDHTAGRTHVLRLRENSSPEDWNSGDRDSTVEDDWLAHTIDVLADIGAATGERIPVPLISETVWTQARLRHDRNRYLALIEDALEQIRVGESYEVCLTNMASVTETIDPRRTFEFLRGINPTPYSALLDFTGIAVISASPERFLRVDSEGNVESKPIKGTRPRGVTRARDAALRQDLLDSEKDRAENLMIVDLTRNDLAKVCVPGSVHVPRLFGIESYSSVHQMVSTVRGALRAGSSAVDCVRAAFPGGSMTGAPKVRTMEIIDRLESGPRGVYSGSIGYFALGGAADLSIVIRSLVATSTGVSFGIGGAITALSDAEEEFDETTVKASTLLRALDVVASHTDELGR